MSILNAHSLPTFKPSKEWKEDLAHLQRRRQFVLRHYRSKLANVHKRKPKVSLRWNQHSSLQIAKSQSVPLLKTSHRRKNVSNTMKLEPLEPLCTQNKFGNVVHYRPQVSFTINLPISQNLNYGSNKKSREKRRKQALQRHAELELTKKARLWDIQLHKHKLPQRKVLKQRNQIRQKAWIKVILGSIFALEAQRIIKAGRRSEAVRRKSISAANLLGSSWKESYASRKAVQHRRSIEILREKAWIARLNVRSRMRKRESIIVRNFVIEASKAGKFMYVCRAFRYKILTLQRRIRSFLVVHKTRLEHMLRFFRKYEGSVLRRLTREQNERTKKEEESRYKDLVKRADAARNVEQVQRSRKQRHSRTVIGRYIKQIQEVGRQLDSVAFRISRSEKAARERIHARRQGESNLQASSRREDFLRVSRAAALSVLRKYLRKKREEHFEALQAYEAEKHRRLANLNIITMENARQILKHDLSLDELRSKRLCQEMERNKFEFPPCVLAFTYFKRDLNEYIIERAIKVQANMNRKARKDALADF